MEQDVSIQTSEPSKTSHGPIDAKLLYVVIAILTVVVVYLLVRPLLNDRQVYVQCPECPDCPECPECGDCPKVVEYRNSTQTRYVCQDNTIVDDPDECFSREELPELNPVLTNEAGTLIKNVEVKPACVGGFRGGYIYYEV